MRFFPSLNPRVRIQQHVEYLKAHIQIGDETDQKNFDHVYENFCTVARKLRIYQWSYLVITALLYISIVTALASAIHPALEWLLEPLRHIASLVGFTVLSMLWFGIGLLIRTIMMDLLAEHSHLIALLVKHNDEFIAHPEFKFGLVKDYR